VDVRRAYCSAVDRNVPVRLKAGAAPRDRVSLHDPADLVCLDYGVRCTGWCCPLYSISDDDGVVVTARAGGRAGASRAAASLSRSRSPHGPRA
jgi:hypothetical protein